MPSKSSLRIPLLFVAFLCLVASRRWEQLASPQVWAEDGGLISGFIGNGWREFLQPVNGYLILVPKMVTRVSMAVSIYYYPIVSAILAFLFAALTGVAAAIAPTRLRGRVLCAFSIFLVPSDSEVFGLPLYTFWWASILLLLLALWDERRPALGFRLVCVTAAGLSSPFVFVVLPVLCFRALLHRKLHAERIVAFAATGVAAVQMYFISRGTAMAFPTWASFSRYVVPRFCGWFLLGNFWENSDLLWPLGLLVVTLIAAFWYGSRRDPTAWILVYLYCGAIASSIFRIDPAALHPIRAGPRYFFLPFVLTFWILIQFILATDRKWIRVSVGIIASVAVLDALPVWSRRHDDLQWEQHLVSARMFSRYEIPIQSDGHRFSAWYIGEPGATWDGLILRDWFLSPEDLAGLPTFAYRIVRTGDIDDGPDPAMGRAGEAEDGGRTISVVSTGSRKEVELRLTAGRRIRFRSGQVDGSQSMQVVGYEKVFIPSLPITKDWVTLEFSNFRLPKEFTVRISDQGHGVGEWSEAGPGN